MQEISQTSDHERPDAVIGVRGRIRAVVEHRTVQRFIIALIVLNAITMGLETSSSVMASAGSLILTADRVFLVIFSIEITARIIAHGHRFFRDPWSVFDFLVVGVAWIPASESASVLRALRVLRVLRLVSAVPQMRKVVGALLRAIPGIGTIAALLMLIFYVAAVMATKLFAAEFPDWFGTIGASLYTLFQIMTLESWSMGIVRPVMDVYPQSWLFFVPFILIATFTVLNLFIAVIVEAMQSAQKTEGQAAAEAATAEREQVLEEIRSLRAMVEDLSARLPARATAEGRS